MSRNYFSIKTKDPAQVKQVQELNSNIVITNLNILQDKIQIDDFVFVVFGGDKPTGWQPGLVALGHVSKLPYKKEGKNFQINIDVDTYFNPIVRADLVPYPATYGIIGIAPIVKWEPNQALSQITEERAVSLLQAILELRNEERGNIESILPKDLLLALESTGLKRSVVVESRLFDKRFLNCDYLHKKVEAMKNDTLYCQFISAIKTKPFLLLAGISGTGKSRIVRELARACWDSDSEEYTAQKPRNFEMVQVKPNWHDSSELIGYVSRISETPTFVAGDFIKFVARAWEEPEVPYFLCLDEMNLAPVEQYFAEFLSVVESRKANTAGVITTDPILKVSPEQWYIDLCGKLTHDGNLQDMFINEGISLPQNLIVIGTVNMDETTFSFSRKVLDRAMTIEMNEVDLYGGLESRYESIDKINPEELIATAVEGFDIYESNKDNCNIVLNYLTAVNNILNGTPFKVAYRTRNEFLLYVINNLPYNIDENGDTMDVGHVIAEALDEVTSMKILSRIEGDDTKVSEGWLKELSSVISKGLTTVYEDFDTASSKSLMKLEEMTKRLSSGYTNFWS